MKKTKSMICYVHDDVAELIQEVLKMIEDDNIDKRKIIPRLKNILILIADAKKMGEGMENRLQEYYNGVVDMGFKRI